MVVNGFKTGRIIYFFGSESSYDPAHKMPDYREASALSARWLGMLSKFGDWLLTPRIRLHS